MTAALFVLCAGAGAAIRHLVNHIGTGWRGTMALNVAGAFALGILLATDASSDTTTILGVGVLGSVTTFSTFSLEVAEAPRRHRLVIVGGTVGLGVAAAALGHAVG